MPIAETRPVTMVLFTGEQPSDNEVQQLLDEVDRKVYTCKSSLFQSNILNLDSLKR